MVSAAKAEQLPVLTYLRVRVQQYAAWLAQSLQLPLDATAGRTARGAAAVAALVTAPVTAVLATIDVAAASEGTDRDWGGST